MKSCSYAANWTMAKGAGHIRPCALCPEPCAITQTYLPARFLTAAWGERKKRIKKRNEDCRNFVMIICT